MSFLERVDKLGIPPRFAESLKGFYRSYVSAVPLDLRAAAEARFDAYLSLIIDSVQNPYPFPPYHRKIEKPFDYGKFALDFFRPLIVFEESKLVGTKNLDRIAGYVSAGENVILFANHQTEPDPQILKLMVEKTHPELASELIFVAGDRVTTDPIAVPASKGCNLFCIHSKKHIENPPEKKAEKLAHNQRTLRLMGEMLSAGGLCIYIAPSGGRDRKNAEGVVEVAPFDPQSIELLYLIARSASRPTHFFPLTLDTYAILPPPPSVEKELGEVRTATRAPVTVSFGPEIDMENFPGSEEPDKKERRQKRAHHIWTLVKEMYR
ncbi:MAG: 1-acyl-sn-glycerol-3-phosphate acyltransferase [Chlamydiia bacterium]|nr:1-acyl-sn-glycerol-3-phosphate acyltransferase [Chlamydiia bacterium]